MALLQTRSYCCSYVEAPADNKMKFDIEFTDLKKKGHVEATLITLNKSDDKTQAEVPTVRYTIRFPTEQIVLHKIIKSGEWFPEDHNPHIPQDIIKRCITEIEKFER